MHEKAKFDAIRAQFAEVLAVLIIAIFFFSLNLCGSDLSCSSNPCRLSVTSQSFNILKQRRDLNSILPVRYIIHKESSMK